MSMIQRHKHLELELSKLKQVERDHDYAAGYEITITALGKKNPTSVSITLTDGFEQFVDSLRNQMLLERDIAVQSLKAERDRIDEYLKGIGK